MDMDLQPTQLKVALPAALHEFLKSKAEKFGVSMAAYVRHLILEDVVNMEFPEHRPSQWAEEQYGLAKKHEKRGKLILADSIDKLLSKL